MMSNKHFKVFISSPSGSRDYILELRIVGRGKDEMEQRRDAQRQTRSYLNNLTYRLEPEVTVSHSHVEESAGPDDVMRRP